MDLVKRIRALLPSNKWCGCSSHIEDSTTYQFRVRAEETGSDENLFQVRERHYCEECDTRSIDVLLEAPCQYDPYSGIHDRKVGVDEDDMRQYGFMPEEELIRMLVEMRLTNALDPQLSEQ